MTERARRLLPLALAVALGTACVRTPVAPSAAPASRHGADPFAYVREPIVPVVAVLDADADEPWSTAELRFASHDLTDPMNPEVRAVVRTPRETARGSVVVVPVLSGAYEAADGFARHLSARGFTTVRLDRKRGIFDPGEDFTRVAQRVTESVVDLRRVLDWMRDAHVAGAEHIGLVGLSAGGMIGSLAAAVDERIDSTVLVMAGASFTDVFDAASDNDAIEPFVLALEERGWDRARILAEAHAALDPLDPGHFAGRMDPRTTLLVNGRFDGIVSIENGDELWLAAGRPERIVAPIGHYTAWTLLPYLHSVTAAHLEAHLTAPRNEPAPEE